MNCASWVRAPEENPSNQEPGRDAMRSPSTHGQQRDSLILVISGRAKGVGVEHRFAIHQELVAVMAMRQLDFGRPCAIGAAAHWVRPGLPSIEVANQAHGRGRRRSAVEMDRLDGLPGRIAIRSKLVMERTVHCLRLVHDSRLVSAFPGGAPGAVVRPFHWYYRADGQIPQSGCKRREAEA